MPPLGDGGQQLLDCVGDAEPGLRNPLGLLCLRMQRSLVLGLLCCIPEPDNVVRHELMEALFSAGIGYGTSSCLVCEPSNI